MESKLNKTSDGFISRVDGGHDHGLITDAVREKIQVNTEQIFDVIIIGAGFAGLIAARELSLRDRTVLILEAKDRIGGRALTAEIDEQKYEIGGTWIHWSQPHIWTEMTRYGLTLSESDGASTDEIIMVFEQGASRKIFPITELYPKLFDMMNQFADIDGVQGRTIFPLPHSPLAVKEQIDAYDHLSMQDRFNAISHLFNDDMRQIFDGYLSTNSQCNLTQSGYLDHLCFWALGDYQTDQVWEKTSRYQIRQGTTALAQAMLNDCKSVQLLVSTPIEQIKRIKNQLVEISTSTGQKFISRTALITVPLNVLHDIQFDPPLNKEKQRAFSEGQCQGGTKFWAKLQQPMGHWCGFAAYPNPITSVCTQDSQGSVVVGFGPDNALDIDDLHAVERELQKFVPNCRVQSTFGHDWRADRCIQSTWSRYRPGQISSNLHVFQSPEPPLFFASGDISNSWRGCLDGALESGLTAVRHVQEYLKNRVELN